MRVLLAAMLVCALTVMGPVVAPIAAVTIHFDNLGPGEVVDDDYPEAVFFSPDGPIQTVPLGFAPSPPNVICTVPAGGGPTCASDVHVVFAGPVDDLSFVAVGAKNAGVVATVEIISNGAVVGVENVVSPGGDGTTPILVDLTTFLAVDEIRIVAVDDPAGLAFDDFVFTPVPLLLFFDGFESGDVSFWSGAMVGPPPALVTVFFPANIAGDYPAGDAAFGMPLDITGVTADLEYVEDGVGMGSDACEPLVGFAPGTIALIDQGFCEFGTQVLNAEIAGALAAVVISNTGDVLITMDPGMDGGAVMIPSAFLGQTDGDLIKAELGQPITVNLHANLPFAEERR